MKNDKLTALTFDFVKKLDGFSFEVSSMDHVWNILFPAKGDKWHHLCVTMYSDTFYITWIDGGYSMEVKEDKGVQTVNIMSDSNYFFKDHDQMSAAWALLIKIACKWLEAVRKNWIKANRQVMSGYPLRYRFGVVSHALIRASLPGIYRLDKELGSTKTRKLLTLIEYGFFNKDDNTVVSSMTAADYFDYCRIAYIAGRRKGEKIDKSLSGREMYSRYADGRHEGLLDIDPGSEHEFADWIDGRHPKRGTGGHPWEIKRGGNTTHIDLAVSRPSLYRKEGFKVELRCESTARMLETLRMLLAIYDAGIPISIADPAGVRKRLLAQDNIGIIPSYAPLHRANQHFSRDKYVFDVMHYDDLGRFKRRIAPFITWEPLPILRPRDV